VAIDDRRLHVARAVALHPAVCGEREAVEPLAEVLDHVVVLELAMDQDIDADLLLDPRSEEHTSELQSRENLVCRLLLEKTMTRDGGIRANNSCPLTQVRGQSGFRRFDR